MRRASDKLADWSGPLDQHELARLLEDYFNNNQGGEVGVRRATSMLHQSILSRRGKASLVQSSNEKAQPNDRRRRLRRRTQKTRRIRFRLRGAAVAERCWGSVRSRKSLLFVRRSPEGWGGPFDQRRRQIHSLSQERVNRSSRRGVPRAAPRPLWKGEGKGCGKTGRRTRLDAKVGHYRS